MGRGFGGFIAMALLFKTNKDEVLCGRSQDGDENLVCSIYRSCKGEQEGVIAIIYGDYPNIYKKTKFFPGEGQVKFAKKWIDEELKKDIKDG